jgi:uncharacterized integral membrane protein
MVEVPGNTTGSGAARGAKPRDRRRDTRLIVTGVVAVLLVWFALANLQDVSIHFWVSTTKAPLILVIIISGALGALIGVMATRRRKRADSEGAHGRT